jgi:hypothetical protein
LPFNLASILRTLFFTKNFTEEANTGFVNSIKPSDEELLWISAALEELFSPNALAPDSELLDVPCIGVLLDADSVSLEEDSAELDDDFAELDEIFNELDEVFNELDEDLAELDEDFAELDEDTGETRFPRVLNSTWSSTILIS